MSLRIDYAHNFAPEDARARIKALGEYLANKHGLAVSWTSDTQAKVTGKYLVVTIDGTVTIEPKMVRFEGKDPGMLFRGKAKEYLSGKLGKYLDPATPVDALPRS